MRASVTALKPYKSTELGYTIFAGTDTLTPDFGLTCGYIIVDGMNFFELCFLGNTFVEV